VRLTKSGLNAHGIAGLAVSVLESRVVAVIIIYIVIVLDVVGAGSLSLQPPQLLLLPPRRLHGSLHLAEVVAVVEQEVLVDVL